MSTLSTVFIVDDDEPARESLVAVVESMGFEALSFESGEEFLVQVTPDSFGCLITDVRMPGMSGIELQKTLIDKRIPLAVIVITAYVDTQMAVGAMRSGAVTFLEKTCSENELCDAISLAMRKGEELRCQAQTQKTIRNQMGSLTESECEVLKMLAQGRLNKQIASDLDISIRTVENRRQKVMEKLGVKSFAELMRVVLQSENFPSIK